MLIPFKSIHEILSANNIQISGAFHIGAHACEELGFYGQLGLLNTDIVWIDANYTKVLEAKAKGIPNVYTATVADQDDVDMSFNISNNFESSSILELGTHKDSYPDIVYVDKINTKSITIDTFFERNNLDASKYNFWNFDIQGAELMALKAAAKSIQHAKAIYLEVNYWEVYKGGALIHDIDAFLANYKFKRVITEMTDRGWGDALYIAS